MSTINPSSVNYSENALGLLTGMVYHLFDTGRTPVYVVAFRRYTNSNAIGFHMVDGDGVSMYPMLIDLGPNADECVDWLLERFGTVLEPADQPHWQRLLPMEFADKVPAWCNFKAARLRTSN